MALCGIPMFVLEVAVGQYLGEGGMTLVGRLCPLLGGTGMATMVLVSLLNIYYCVIVGWAIFYLIVSLATLPSLPWDTCQAWWNTDVRTKQENILDQNILYQKCLNFNSSADVVKERLSDVKTPVEGYWR